MATLKSCLKKTCQHDPYVGKDGSSLTREHCHNLINQHVRDGQWGMVQAQVTRTDPRGCLYGEFYVDMEFVYEIYSNVQSYLNELRLAGYDHCSQTDSNGWQPMWIGLDGVGYGRALSAPRKAHKLSSVVNLFDNGEEGNLDYFYNFSSLY